MSAVAYRFDEAAPAYDDGATVQREIAETLVGWAELPVAPQQIVDLGCGTGFVASRVRQRWPAASLVGVDLSERMLIEAGHNVAGLKTLRADASCFRPTTFDAVFSSMALQWMDSPVEVLSRWIEALMPGAHVFAALPTSETFPEWRRLCADLNVPHALWDLPHPFFADGFVKRSLRQRHLVTYGSAEGFVRHLKATGAATARKGSSVLGAGAMRQLLRQAPRPFPVTYDILYIDAAKSTNV